MCKYKEWRNVAQGDEGLWGKECYCTNPNGNKFCNSSEDECKLLKESRESENQ